MNEFYIKIHFRKSNTEPIYRLVVESLSKELTEKYTNMIADSLDGTLKTVVRPDEKE